MDDKLERIFINFADGHEDSLKQMGLSKEEFIEQANQWSATEEGKLEIQKFILTQEIKELKEQVTSLNDSISKKEESIKEIDDEISKL